MPADPRAEVAALPFSLRTDYEQMAKELAAKTPPKQSQQEEAFERARHNRAIARLMRMEITI